jgi:hypothetical protein
MKVDLGVNGCDSSIDKVPGIYFILFFVISSVETIGVDTMPWFITDIFESFDKTEWMHSHLFKKHEVITVLRICDDSFFKATIV